MAAGPVNRHARRLVDVRAKSKPAHDPERLTAHSLTVRSSSEQIRKRIGIPPALAADTRMWECVRAAALLHDAGKVAAGFQQQLLPGEPRWGERHEVLSLAYVDILARTAGWSTEERLLVATLVATHHRALFPGSEPPSKPAISQQYNDTTDWAEAFTVRHHLGSRQVQVTRSVHEELVAWLARELRIAPPLPEDAGDGIKLANRARRVLNELYEEWRRPVDPVRGLSAVLAQGALTLADHAGSAHRDLQTHMPLPADYMQRFPYTPHDHQRLAAGTDGHLILVAPTGSGKTEGGLAWAARQLRTMPAQPRLVWTLPYRASLNAARDRLRRDLQAAEGERQPDIGLLHGTLASTLLRESLEDECTPGEAEPGAALARQARSRAAAMRLFVQRARVATPHQLLNGAVAGPSHSSVLLEQANALFVLDELHAYAPETFGRLCATLRLWERLGSRVAVLSATLAPQMTEIIEESLVEQRVSTHRAAPGTSPDRHRVVLDDQLMTAPPSLAALRAWIQQGYSVLAVVNKVATAQELFELLAGDAREAVPDDPDAALLLHSRFKNQDRAAIEKRLLERHRERKAGDPARRGGLVVATQTVEVSLQLDFDRGAVEAAPVEAVAQRAGRVNRRGLHPEGPVEFHVHQPAGHEPYEEAAVAAAWAALSAHTVAGTGTLSEQDIDRLLADAYDTAWGEDWVARARMARDAFARTFLTFDQPFHDRSEFAEKLSREFDGVEVVHVDDVDTYRERTKGREGDPLLAAELLIPLRYGQLKAFEAEFDRHLGIRVVHAPYTAMGLQRPDQLAPPSAPETIL
ncbi:CRISPR-associated helicase/endonuclease Cas3 [Streptomyces sp. WMMB 322]|uniref:CRISPR-associated helicase/endonuclease Cas3 n=1 Tax=Streptomyces sp. WMMB 322 TaxID=1286821 RepID=UPI0006E134A3|nr:CRISPR-associated helicase/endonuclease Cas3 [Streptomyces sp. WMMB 322]SCK12542.1 CRISPR-associated helicase, Cas3 family [Streptomyces sp. WMMB 322]